MQHIANVREIDFVDGLSETDILDTSECGNDVIINATLSHLYMNLCIEGRGIKWYFNINHHHLFFHCCDEHYLVLSLSSKCY